MARFHEYSILCLCVTVFGMFAMDLVSSSLMRATSDLTQSIAATLD